MPGRRSSRGLAARSGNNTVRQFDRRWSAPSGTMTAIDPRVERHIESLNLSCRIRQHRDFPTEIRTPADFADALGYQPARITKSVFCRSQSKAAYAVLVAPNDQRID